MQFTIITLSPAVLLLRLNAARLRYLLVDKAPVTTARSKFRDYKWFQEGKIQPVNHSHPAAATLRNGVDNDFTLFCHGIGSVRVDVQSNSSAVAYYHRRQNTDPVDNKKPSRTPRHPISAVFSVRDLASGLVNTSDWLGATLKLPAQPYVTTIVDTDYYLDMHQVLANTYPNPVLLYTLRRPPTSAPVADGRLVYYNGVVKMSVCGGASYEHQIWDWNHDYISVRSGFYTYHYQVEFVDSSFDANRSIVLLNPLASHLSLPFIVPSASALSRLDNSIGSGFSGSVLGQRGSDNKISLTACVGHPDLGDAVFPFDLLTPLLTCDLGNTADANAVVRFSKENGYPLTVSTATLITQLPKEVLSRLRKSRPLLPAAVGGVPRLNDEILPQTEDIIDDVRESPPGSPAKHYAAEPDALDHDLTLRTTGMVVGPNVATPSFLPSKCAANDRQCIAGRITSVANTTRMSDEVKSFADDFVKQIAPPFTLTPVTLSEVYARQNRPAQVRKQKDARRVLAESTGEQTIKTFQKSECYPAITDPRNISTVEADHQISLSSYTYALKAYLKETVPSYCSGKTPSELEEHLMSISGGGVVFLQSTDHSRCDGRQGYSWRYLERALLLHCFPRKHHKEIRYLCAAERNQRCRTANGVVYNNRESRLSGSPLTTEGNTIGNLFEMYVYLRRNGYHDHSAFKVVSQECASLGDDGLVVLAEPEHITLQDSAELNGMKITTNPCNQSLGYYEFLSRWWFISPTGVTSVAEPTRLLTKLHISADKSKPWRQKLFERACGIYVTERHTPVVAEWCNMVFRLLGRKFDPRVTDQHRMVFTSAQADLHWAAYAAALGCETSHLRRICVCIKAHKNLEEPISLRLKVPLPVKLKGYLSNFDVSTGCN